jgi:PAS domain S-box-containing protein
VDRAAYDDETRVRLEEALKESEQRFERLVEAAKDYAIFMVDAEGFVTTWNEGGQRVFGYEEGEIVGEDASVLFTPEDRRSGRPEREMETARTEGRAGMSTHLIYEHELPVLECGERPSPYQSLSHSSLSLAAVDLFSTVPQAPLDCPADRRLAHLNPTNYIEKFAPLSVGSPRTVLCVFLEQSHGTLVQLRSFAWSLPWYESPPRRVA